MTICVATLCGRTNATRPVIVGASDRLLSSPILQYQPNTKIYFHANRSLVFMIAGDPSLEVELIGALIQSANTWLEANPGQQWPLALAADAYRESYAEAKRKRAEAALLRPHGLDSASFLAASASMSQSLVRDIRFEIDHFPMDAVGTIIAGFDAAGTHLYVADGADVRCADADGFAAIGTGGVHAASELANAGHTVEAPLDHALISTYSAKKRAELAPTVGPETDMFVLGASAGSYAPIPPDAIKELDRIYRRWASSEDRARARATLNTRVFIERVLTPPTLSDTQAPESPRPSIGAPPPPPPSRA